MSGNIMWSPAALGGVRVTDPYCKNAFEKEREYLLSLSAGRLLAGFYENAGLKTSFVRYAGWEGMLIGGHTLGHYLSALSLAYASSGDGVLERLGLILSGLSECQEAVGTGLIWGAAPVEGGVEGQFDNVEAGKTDIMKQAWVPWYTLHKLLAGLVEAARLPGPVGEQALGIARKLGDWVVQRALGWDARTRKRVLAVEYGGMNDSLYALYELTREERYACAAHVFDEDALFEGILAGRKDFLDGKHANTTIPKFLGALNRYVTLHGETVGGKRVDAGFYLAAARAFFDTVVLHHTYVTGGNSEWEHFGKDDILDAERTNCNCETCNVYNMLKLARGLFAVTGESKYLDYYDNAFTNAILSSQDPETGMTTYFQPMAGGFFKVFSRPYDKFWCCTGSGMENFSKLGDGIFYLRGESIAIGRYLSSELNIAGARIAVEADLPMRSDVTISAEGDRTLSLFLRIPDWCDGARLEKNGSAVAFEGRFARVPVCGGDVLRLHLLCAVSLHGLPDAGDVFAFKYGNAVLSADLGREDMRETETGVEVNIPARRILPTETLYFQDRQDVIDHPGRYMRREGDKFLLQGADIPLTFGLHYKRHLERYAIYYRFREGEGRAEEAERTALDSVQPGYGQYERDALHEMREENTVSAMSERTYRYARVGGYFAYDMRVDPAARNFLEINLGRCDNGKTLRITAAGREIFSERLLYTMGDTLYKKRIELTDEVVRLAHEKQLGGERATVLEFRFEGAKGRVSAKLFESVGIYTEPKT